MTDKIKRNKTIMKNTIKQLIKDIQRNVAYAHAKGFKDGKELTIKLIDERIKNYKKLNKKFPKNQTFTDMWTALFELKQELEK